jgi:hypothetical protein
LQTAFVIILAPDGLQPSRQPDLENYTHSGIAILLVLEPANLHAAAVS